MAFEDFIKNLGKPTDFDLQMQVMETGARELGKMMGVVPKQINFDPPEFCEGINMTVRRGTYWNANLKKGDAVEVGCEIRNEWRPATITNIKVKRFCDMTFEELSYHNCKDCFVPNPAHAVFPEQPETICDKIILEALMNKYYGDFNDTEIVTLIYFRLEPISKS